MRKLIVSSFVSLDGVVGSPRDWALSYWNEDNEKRALSDIEQADAFLMGRVAYQMFSSMWADKKGSAYVEALNRIPKYVASKTLNETPWKATIFDDAAAGVAKLKAEGGKKILKYGLTGLDRTLLQHRLIDEIRLTVMPTAVGRGQRAFEGFDLGGVALKLTDATASANGLALLTYVPTYR